MYLLAWTAYKIVYSINFDLTFYVALICLISVLFYRKQLSKRPLSETGNYSVNFGELNKRLENWQPKDIVPNTIDLSKNKNYVISSKIGKYIRINDVECLDLCTHNYLGLIGNEQIEEKAINTIRQYGVGSCGPRAFYGTMDAHLKLEEDTAKFFELEESICYSYGFCTVTSAITAYCKRKDVVFCDEKISFAAQKGLEIAKCNVIYFKHNDSDNLKHVLSKYDSEIDEIKRNTQKKYVFLEGIYVSTGEVCNLPDILELCRKFKLRVLIDESVSIGVLGETGRGVTEHFNINRDEIDVIIGSYETALSSIGGFCVGSSYIIDHQRLFGSGYCFSASLPPLLANAALTALQILQSNPSMVQNLKKICCFFHEKLSEIDCVIIKGHAESPIKYVVPKNQDIVESAIDYCYNNGLAIGDRNSYSLKQDKSFQNEPKSIRLIAHLNLTTEDILKACDILKQSLL